MPLLVKLSLIEIITGILKHSDAMLGYWDKNLICRFANDAYRNWFGIEPDAMINKMYLWELLGQSLYQNNLKYIDGALNGHVQVFERFLQDRSGQMMNTRATYTPNFVEGQVDGFFVQVVILNPMEKKIVDNEHLPQKKAFLNPTDHNLDEVIQTLRSWIFTGFPSIAALAKKHFISESKLKRDFKEKYNDTIFSYYRMLQMEFAERYIAEKRYNKSQMASLLNFSNPSNFSKCYQKYLKDKSSNHHSAGPQVINYKAFIEQEPIAIAMFDIDMHFIAASLKWIEDYDLQDKDITGCNLYELLPEFPSQFQDLLPTCLKGEIYFDDGIVEKKDGTLSWMHWDIRPWYDDSKEVGGFMIMTQNYVPFRLSINENKEVLEILNKTQKIARIGAWSRNFKDNTTVWSKVLKEMLEVPADFTPDLETAISFYKEGENRDRAAIGLKNAMLNAKPFGGDFEMITAKGHLLKVKVAGYPEFKDGKCEKLSGILIDITF
ncbi:PAS domain-containing protein [Mucilaginibacter sp. AW1-7]|jgi:PAS domain S-box-containing protein|uniref:PAS domain-containing protein n=1 Tax=unclassified Mucilaginibacter TaxID=2617802 RepID=UPI0008B0DE89|nr:PAS domain-containing protein [Mucilaginibacter sp. OK283]SEP39762.1 PAS domain S-box-containing protein [Mucilaginibacter sp. OK283]